MDKTLQCKDCGNEFYLTESQVKFFNEKIEQDPNGWSMPKRCVKCRLKKKQEKEGGSAY